MSKRKRKGKKHSGKGKASNPGGNPGEKVCPVCGDSDRVGYLGSGKRRRLHCFNCKLDIR